MSDAKTEAFNLYTANWILRIDAMTNSVIIVSGGVMSLTIGAFLSSKSPALSSGDACFIKWSWFLLAISLACSILLKFVLVVSGGIVLRKWEEIVKIKPDGRVIVDSPTWVHVVAWILGAVAVLLCVVGLGLISMGAGALITRP